MDVVSEVEVIIAEATASYPKPGKASRSACTMTQELPITQSSQPAEPSIRCTQSAHSTHRGPLSFLEMPTEIRLQIYGYFKDIPESATASSEISDREQILQTRDSLHLICRVVNKEWWPLFYASFTIAIGGEGDKSLERLEMDFLLQPLPHKLTNLRSLSYRITTDRTVSLGWLHTQEAAHLAGILSSTENHSAL